MANETGRLNLAAIDHRARRMRAEYIASFFSRRKH